MSGLEGCPRLQLFPERIPAAWGELTHTAVLIPQKQLAPLGNSSNRCEAHAAKRIRQELCLAWGRGEQQFVVISAMQREVEWIVVLFEGDIWESEQRNLRALQLGTDRACSAKP